MSKKIVVHLYHDHYFGYKNEMCFTDSIDPISILCYNRINSIYGSDIKMNSNTNKGVKDVELDFKYSTNPNQHENTKTNSSIRINPVADILFKIGVGILLLGIIIGLIIMFTLKDPVSSVYGPNPHPLRYVYGILAIFSSIMSGFLFIGLGEIIRQLTHIRESLLKW